MYGFDETLCRIIWALLCYYVHRMRVHTTYHMLILIEWSVEFIVTLRLLGMNIFLWFRCEKNENVEIIGMGDCLWRTTRPYFFVRACAIVINMNLWPRQYCCNFLLLFHIIQLLIVMRLLLTFVHILIAFHRGCRRHTHAVIAAYY